MENLRQYIGEIVVKCEDGTVSDNYEAFTAALAKKVFGSNSAVKKIVSKTERVKPEILNSKEKDYLKNGYDYYFNLPLFDCNSMFLEMEEEREYTLKELGLEEKEKEKEIDLPWQKKEKV